uniref:Uncharacterized protein n=1 Tax=Anguilla anguilla TaxID=7936 RepID=A0A0E9RFG4_ANGAN
MQPPPPFIVLQLNLIASVLKPSPYSLLWEKKPHVANIAIFS